MKENYQLDILIQTKNRDKFKFTEFVHFVGNYLSLLQSIHPSFRKLYGIMSEIPLNQDFSNLPQLLEKEAVDDDYVYYDENNPQSKDFSYNSSSSFGYDVSLVQANNGGKDEGRLQIDFSMGWDEGGGNVCIQFPYGEYNDESFYQLSFIKDLIKKSILYWNPFVISFRNHDIDDIFNTHNTDDALYNDFSWLTYINDVKVWEYLPKEIQQKSEKIGEGVLISFVNEFPNEISKELEKEMKEVQKKLLKKGFLDYPYQ